MKKDIGYTEDIGKHKKKSLTKSNKSDHKHEYIKVALQTVVNGRYVVNGKLKTGNQHLFPATVCKHCGRIKEVRYLPSVEEVASLKDLPRYVAGSITSKKANKLD